MSVPTEIAKAGKDSDLFWCCLYAVEREGKTTLIYGYAVSAQESPSQWASSLIWDSATWRLSRINCFITASTLSALCESLLSGRLQLSARKGEIEIQTEELCRRPTIYAIPRDSISSSSPQSFSDDPAAVDSYWCLSKKTLIEKLFPQNAFPPDQLREATGTLFRHLKSETGICFLSNEASRFGNFEIVRYLSGDIRRSDGLCSMVSRSDTSLVAWIEPPLQERANLFVNCRMFNGRTVKARACILNELRAWQPGTPLWFSPAEPYSDYEISAWHEGKVVAYQHHTLIRSTTVNIGVAGPELRLVTNWSKRFQGRLREQAESVRLDTTQRVTGGSSQQDPWRIAEAEASALIEAWFPSETEGRFFVNAQQSTLEAVEFLARLLQQPRIIRVTIVDPFFDRIGVESLLARLAGAKEVKVLTSHVSGIGGTVDGTIDLAAACETCRSVLPQKLEVINIQSPGGTTQQFHDRYIVIQCEDDQQITHKEVWMLSNSLSSLAIRYPLVVVPLAQEVANQVADFVASLDNGQVAGRSGTQSRVVWTNHPQSIPKVSAPAVRPSREFPGWKLILEVLVPDEEAEEKRAKAAVMKGLLTAHLPEIDWHVPAEAIPHVVTVLKAGLSAQAANRDGLLSAICHWAYHGGPSATEYSFDEREIAAIRDALAQHLADQAKASQISWEFPPLRDSVPLPECLEHLWNLLGKAPLDRRNGATPELFFLAEALWASSPQTLVQLLDTTRSLPLLCWISTEGHSNDDRSTQALFGSRHGASQALGILFLRDMVNTGRDKSGKIQLEELAKKLAATGLPRFELLLSMIFVSSRYTRSDVTDPKPFAACASFWPDRPLSDDERKRVATLIDRAAPNRAIPMVSALAGECPQPEDAAGFRQWCVEQTIALLPLKPAIIPQEGIRVVADEITLSKAADAAWQLHGAATPAWFRDVILNKMNLWAALEPLLRARDYTRWSGALEGVLLTMFIGFVLSETSPDKKSREDFQTATAPPIARVLLKLGPELWHHFADNQSRLVNVVVFLGLSADLLNASEIEDIENIVTNEGIPSLWRLLLIVRSLRLARKYASKAVLLAAAPTTPACHRHSSTIEGWARIISKFATELAQAHEDTRSTLNDVAKNIAQWRAALLPETASTQVQ